MTATAIGATIRLSSDTAGVPFNISYPVSSVLTVLSGTNANTSVTLNQTLNYQINWYGPGISSGYSAPATQTGGEYLLKYQ